MASMACAYCYALFAYAYALFAAILAACLLMLLCVLRLG
jgi:hypothetical protein